MELAGEEKKIQTLFSELRLADEQTAPSFSAIWNRAQARALRPRRAFNLSFVAAIALLICALVSLAWWSRHWQRTRQPNVVAITSSGVVPDLKPSEVAPASKVSPTPSGSEPKKPASAEHRFEVSARLRAERLAARQEANLLANAKKQATAISSWQSPTATLLSSPNDDLLKSLPQLNESANDLKSFLPNTPK